jgi:hypothetical protein
MKPLRTTADVLAALGGTETIRHAFGVSPQVVSNWRVRNRFPAHTYVLFMMLLDDVGVDAPNKLWPMRRKTIKRKKR